MSQKQQQKNEWIITPGLKPTVDEFIEQYNLHYSPESSYGIKNRPLLISGPPGVGKSLFVHIFKTKYSKDYPNRPYKELYVPALNENQIDNEFNSFTSGLIILDGISDSMPALIKSKITAFLDYRCSDVTVIALSNSYKSTDEQLEPFNFRFYFFPIPPLYKRRGDILYYFYHFDPDIFLLLTETHIINLLSFDWQFNVNLIKDYLSVKRKDYNIRNRKIIDDFQYLDNDFFLKSFESRFNFPPAYEIDFRVINAFLKEIGLKTEPKSSYDKFIIKFKGYNPACIDTIPSVKINKSSYKDLGLSYIEPNDEFEKYIIAFKALCYYFWEPYDLKTTLFTIEEGCRIKDNIFNTPHSLDHSDIIVLNFLNKFLTPELYELREKIRCFRMGENPSNIRITSKIAREKVEKVVLQLLVKDPSLTTPELSKMQEIIDASQYYTKDKLSIPSNKTLRKWINKIRSVNKGKPGRPRKK
ncbi:MAG: hypothetical protein L7F78_04685 [Syntrophales bacterium LBB04]|nr:hypothetical protein [Syntrophales bacterium LBB04]